MERESATATAAGSALDLAAATEPAWVRAWGVTMARPSEAATAPSLVTALEEATARAWAPATAPATGQASGAATAPGSARESALAKVPESALGSESVMAVVLVRRTA
jgi:hypothetical protein